MSTKIIAQLNPFSSERKIWNEDDSSISEIIKKIDCTNVVNAGWRVLLNDEIITDFSTVTHDGDTVYIKIVPEGDSPKELGAGEKIAGGLLTALGVASFFIPGLGPAVGIALIGSGIGLFANGCVMYNLDLSQKDRESPVQDPSIRGSKNQIRQYGNIPILFGKRRIYPDLATTAYTWVENGQQYLYQLFCCGQKNQTIDTSTIKIGETLLTDYSSSGNIEDVLSGDDSLIQMQIAYGENTPPLLTKCVHEDILNTVLKHQTEDELDGSIVRTTPENTTEINVDIFFYNGLGQYNDDGDVEDCSVTVKAWYKRSDQDDSHYVQLGHFTSDDVITEHELKTKRFSIHKTGLTANSYTVKIERVTEDSDDSKIIDQCYVGSIRAIKNESPVSSARCRQLTLIGLKIKSSEKLNNYIEQLNFISQSSLPCYSGTGSGALQWNNAISSNPASAAIYAMQGEVSQQKLNNSEIDWPAFEKLYTWCNQHEYECNEYLTDSMSISELLSAIGSTCRAEIFRQNGKITVIQDIERDGFVQLFTPRNSWDYEESIEMPDIPDAMALGFVDEEAGYVKQEAKIYNTSNGEKISEPETTQDVTLWGVTSSKQARKLGMYKYAVSRARPIVHKFSADFEYMLCGKGDWIKYAGDIALAGITQGRIASLIINGNTITGFTSDELLPMEDGQSYAVRIRKNDGTAILKNISSHSEDCMTVYFDTAVSLNVLHEGDLFSFGYVGNDSIDLIITDIHCGDNLSAEIIAVEYSPEIFAVDDSGFVLPTFINRITEIPSIEDSGQLSDIEEPVKIVTTSILYAASSNGITPPVTGWDSSIPTVSPGNFLWTQTKVFYTDNKSTVSYSVAKQGVTGAKGDKGDTGATGPQGAKGDIGAQGPQGIQGAQGVAGENAIVMTSATSPEGSYVGQIGLWQSQLYKWNGTAWENTSAELPTDAILHYSFDEVPDLPDGQNIILRNKNFTSTSEINSLRASKTITNGILKMQQNVSNVEYGVGFRFGTLDSSDVKNKIVVCKLFVSTSVTGNIYFRSVSHVDSTTFYNQKIEQNKWVTVTFVLPSAARNPWFAIIGLDSSLDNYILFETVYIGDGSYNTPIIDNANGQYNGINNGGLATEGVSGKAVRFLGNGYIQGNLPFNPDEQFVYSVSAWVINWDKESDVMRIFNNWNSYKVSSLYLRLSAQSDNIATDVCYEKGKVRRFTFSYPFSTDGLNVYHVVLVASGVNSKLYINGKLISGSSTQASITALDRQWFQIGRSYGSAGWSYSKGMVDDFQLFNRALSEKEILGLYLAKGNTPIYYTLKDYQLASIDDDGIISPSEKKQLLVKWHEIYNADNVTSALPTSSITAQGEYKSVIDDAVSLGILSITAIDNYRQSANALRDLFWGTNGYLNNLKAQSATRTDINLDNLLANYQKALQDARTAIGQQQASVASALGVSNSNPFCLIPVNATTGNPDYTNTGTRLQVFNGTTQLTPKASGTLADGEWKVTVTRDHITEGNQTIGDGYIDFGDVSAMTDTHADLTFNIVAKVNGIENTIYTVQKFTQAQEGADGRIYDLRTEQGVVKKSPEGVLTPSSITVQAYSWTASNPPALFGTGDLKAYENNVQVGTTVSQGNSITVSPSGNYPVVVKLFRHGTNTVLDIINIPVLNEVKGDTGDTGAQGPQGLKGDTGAKGDKGDKGDTGATGAKGDKGDTGAQGLKGDKGNPGERGSKEFSGTEINKITGSAQTETLTTASSGIDSSDMPIYVGDTYVNTLTNDVWNCTTDGTPSTAKWTYQGRRKSDKDDTNLFRFFDAEHDYSSISNTFAKTVQTAENPFGYNDKILHLTNTNGIQYSRAIPYYKSIRVNSNKKYRYVLYIKQNDSKRRDYFGIVDNQSGGGVTHITSLSGGTVSNGYFGSSTNLGTLGNWYMIVAYVMPYSASTTTAPSDAGVYNCSTKRKIGTTVTNYKWKNDGDINITHNGTLIRYADTAKTDTSSADIYDVRFDECNGNEPSIDELLRIDTSVKNKGAWTANADYYIGDIVSHSGSSYICKTNHNSGSAWATTNWDLLSEQGATGNTGKATHVSDYTSTRTWTNAQWNDYTTKGRSTRWSNVTGSPTIKIGDIFIVYATLSEQGNITGQVYCEVTGITGSDSSWTITSKTLYGIKGEKGQSGEDGNGISSISYYYAKTNSQTAPSASSVTSTTIPTLDATYKYLWQKEDISYTDGTNKTTVALIGVYGDTGNKGPDGASIFYSSASATTSTTSITKSTITIPSGQVLKVGDIIIAGSYLTFRVTNAGTGTTCTVQYVANIRGATGAKGDKGDDAVNYSISASMTSASNGTVEWKFYVNGVLATSAYYADVHYSSAGGAWGSSSLTGNFTGTKSAAFTGDVNGYSYKIEVYTDSTKTHLLAGTIVSYGAKGATGASGTSSTSVTVSKENLSIDCLPNRKVMTETSVTISFTGAMGIDKKAVTLSKINGTSVTAGMTIVSGLTLTSFTNGTDSADGSFTIKMASDATLGGTTAASDTIIIPIQFTCNSITFVKQLAITKNILSAVIQLSSPSLNYTLRRDGKSNYESKTVNITVKIGNTERAVTNTTCGTLTGVTASVSSDKKTITINTSSNGNAPNGNLSVSIVSDGVTYTRYISITSSKAGKYLGIATAVSGATVTLKGGSTVTASVGDFITWGGTESSTYHQSYNYQFVRTGSSATSWTSYSDDQDSMTAFSDIMSLLDDASNPNVKANLLVQRLVAADAFIKRLETLSLLFSEYCGSITSQNPSIGDMMIYMGKNPRLTSAAREFQFAISQYLGTRGGQEMWSDKLITKFLASGLLALNLIGCVQATDSVYSRQGEGWKESVDFFKDEINIVTNVVGSKVGGYYAVMDQRGFCYLTEDFISSTKSLSLSNKFYHNESLLDAGVYKKEKIVVITTHNVYYTEDYNEWNVIQDISKATENEIVDCGNWKTPALFYIKLDKSLYITSDFNSWQEITLPFDGDVYITNKYLIIGRPSSDNLILIDNSLQVLTVANVFKTSTYGGNFFIGVNDNTLFAFGGNGISFANEDLTQIQEVSYAPISTVWNDICFYNNRIFFITTEGFCSRLCYIDLNSPSEIIPTDCIYNLSEGAAAYHVTETKGVISVFNTASPDLLYISFDGGNSFKTVECTDSYRFAGGVFYIEEMGIYALIKRDYQWNHKLYTTKGREAGSGIISESIGTENGNIVFSNGLGFKWGNSTPEGASSIVTLPIITPQVVGVGENACKNNTGSNVVGIGNNAGKDNSLNRRISINDRLDYVEFKSGSKEKAVYDQLSSIINNTDAQFACTGSYGTTIIAYASITNNTITIYGPDYDAKLTLHSNASSSSTITRDLQLLMILPRTPDNTI